jgi:hypothetical protein
VSLRISVDLFQNIAGQRYVHLHLCVALSIRTVNAIAALIYCTALPSLRQYGIAQFLFSSLHIPAPTMLECPQKLASHCGSGVFMKKLVEIRSQEFMCRERAMLDSERRIFWLAEAEAWEQRALDEIAYHFRECNLDTADSHAAAN